MRIAATAVSLLFLLCAEAAIASVRRCDAVLTPGTLTGDTVLCGSVTVTGRVTVEEGATLSIEPGTELVFAFVDTDGDGVGESELLSQGRITAAGTAERPVVFRGSRRAPASWLGVSVMGVADENIFSHCRFADAYMALHAHFSALTVRDSRFEGNLRGFQSQEGTIVIERSDFTRNVTGVQFRNSVATVSDTRIEENRGGINFLYSDVTLRGVRIAGNPVFGAKLRHSKVRATDVDVSGSLQNLYVKSTEATFDGVRSAGALQRGISVESSRISLRAGHVDGNLLDGISLDGSTLVCDGLAVRGSGRYAAYLKGGSRYEGSCDFGKKTDAVFVEK